MLIKTTYRRYIHYYDNTIYRTFKRMQKNYFILFRDTDRYREKTDMHGNKHQIQNCSHLCRGGRKCDGGELHRRLQLLFETFLCIK